MFTSRFCRRGREAALASALFLAIGSAAYADPGHGPGGPWGHGGPRGAHVEQVIAQLKSQLNLNTSQQLAFDNAVAATRSARETGRAERERVHAATRAELGNAAPDLAKIAQMADQARTAGQQLHTQVRDQWLALYATFTSEQKLVVRDALVRRMERMDAFRARMHERFGG